MDRNFHFYNATNILVAAFPVIAGSLVPILRKLGAA